MHGVTDEEAKGQDVTNEAMPPPNWYPDPSDAAQLRYWDGANWTEHTSPNLAVQQPVVEQQQPSATLAVAPAAVVAVAPSGPRTWTRGTFATLFVCVTLVIGSVIAGSSLVSWNASAHERQAEEALHGFLEASVTGDESWRDFANTKLLDAVTVGSPLRGEDKTAKALDLKVEYEVGPLEYLAEFTSNPDDLAVADLNLTYTFMLDGQKVTSTAVQEIWLSRPYYYGDDVPSRSTREKASAVGPWRVTSLTLPREIGRSDFGKDYFTTDLRVPFDEELDGGICYSAVNLLEDISVGARTINDISATCKFEGEAPFLRGEDMDFADLAANFPIVDQANPWYLPTELVRIDTGGVNNSVPPLREYLIRGTKGSYVITLALVETTGGDSDSPLTNRIVSIQRVEEDAS